MSHEAHPVEEKSKGAVMLYNLMGFLLAAVIGGGLLYAMIYLLNA
jgi:hypothetical protein